MIRIALADDHTLVRAGVRKLLESMCDVEVVGEVGDGLALMELLNDVRPDIVLTDITMPFLNGLDASVQIKQKWPEIRIIILSMYENEEYVNQAVTNGVAGYLLKDAAPIEFQQAIHSVMAGQMYLSPAVSQNSSNSHVARKRDLVDQEVVLSNRQREVVALIAQGSSTKEVARLLNISPKTVETHRTRLMHQLNVHEVTGLVRYAIRTGIIDSN
jgi:DNA-binding NarL/FixJ family response regulator